jgi:hypothetical protein
MIVYCPFNLWLSPDKIVGGNFHFSNWACEERKLVLKMIFPSANWVRITFNESLRQQSLSSELVIHKLSSLLIINGVNYHRASQFYNFKMIFIVLLLFFVNFAERLERTFYFLPSFHSFTPLGYVWEYCSRWKYRDSARKCDNLPIFTLSIKISLVFFFWGKIFGTRSGDLLI